MATSVLDNKTLLTAASLLMTVVLVAMAYLQHAGRWVPCCHRSVALAISRRVRKRYQQSPCVGAPTSGAPTHPMHANGNMAHHARHARPCPHRPALPTMYATIVGAPLVGGRSASNARQWEHGPPCPALPRIAPPCPASPRLAPPCPTTTMQRHRCYRCRVMPGNAGTHEGCPYDQCFAMEIDAMYCGALLPIAPQRRYALPCSDCAT